MVCLNVFITCGYWDTVEKETFKLSEGCWVEMSVSALVLDFYDFQLAQFYKITQLQVCCWVHLVGSLLPTP